MYKMFFLMIALFLSDAYASVKIHVEELNTGIDLKGYNLQWILHKKDAPNFQLTSEPVPLEIDANTPKTNASGNYIQTLTAPFYPFEYPEDFLNIVYDQIEVKIYPTGETAKYGPEYTERMDLWNRKFKGPIKSLSISVGNQYTTDEETFKMIGYDLCLFIDGVTFHDKSFLYPVNRKKIHPNERMIPYESPSNPKCYFIISHLTPIYADRETIIREKEWVKTQTNVRADSKVKIVDGLFYDKHNQLVNGHNLLYIINTKGEFRIGLNTIDTKEKRLLHSMLAGSKAVVCAGKVNIEEGVLKSIDTDSGHYCPTYEQMREVLYSFFCISGSPIREDLQVGYYTRMPRTCAPTFFKLSEFFERHGK